MRKLTILVDMDDTIENLTTAWIEYANRRFERSVKAEDVTTWDPSESYPGVNHEQLYGLLLEKELYESVRPLPGAVEGLKKLIADGHEVYLLTNTSYRVAKWKMEAILERYFPFIDWLHVVFAAKKQMIRADVLIDDAPHNLVGGAYERLLFTAHHNRSFDAEANGFTRVNDWNEVLARIAEIAAEDAPERRSGEVRAAYSDAPKELADSGKRTAPVIRRAEDKDIPRVTELLGQVLTIHADLRPDLFIPGTTKYTADELRAIFRDEATPVYVAADETDYTIGYVFCVIEEPAESNNMIPRRTLYIDDLCVDETARGKHVGEALYRHALSEAKRLGCYALTLNVWEGNEARRFYDAMGMKTKKTMMEQIL